MRTRMIVISSACLFLVYCQESKTNESDQNAQDVFTPQSTKDILITESIVETFDSKTVESAVSEDALTTIFDIQNEIEFECLDCLDTLEEVVVVDVINDINDASLLEATDGPNYISCGEVGYCPVGYTCFNGTLCCPPNLPQECDNQCYPADCQCTIDEEFTLCLPDGFKYCGKGVACDKNVEEECTLIEAENTFYCLTDKQAYCGNGLICQKDKEDCVQQGEEFFCVSKGKTLCVSGLQCYKEIEVCGVNHCCPTVQPQECNELCCYPDEHCTECGCLPITANCCAGELCVAGYACAPDGSSACYPETGDYCEDGRFCPPGMVCTKDDCCAQGQPQECGGICCPVYYDCVYTTYGKKCIPPDTEPCGDTWCESDEYCAEPTMNLCLHNFATLCPVGQICEDGLFCAGPTCCSMFNPNQDCGGLCCPSNWKCINGGEACIPLDAIYLGNGKYCEVGTKFNEENGNCDPVGWEPCGSGAACPPGKTCAMEEQNKQCCPVDQAALCKDKCCYTGFGCCSENICMPPGAECCWGKNVNEWCSPTTFCGIKGKKCIPVGAMECENGDYCSIGEKCTESVPPCCPWVAPIPCETQCCALSQKCETVDLKKKCIPKDAEVCPGVIINNEILIKDTICYGSTFCEEDNYCMDDSYKNQEYNYCGGGETCPINESCAGLCSDFCCEKEPENEEEKCNLESCLLSTGGWGTPKPTCQENGTTITCCGENLGNSAWIINQIKQCVNEKCGNLNCGQGVYNKFCCTYDKPKTVGCLVGCIPSGRLCYDMPSSSGSLANPIESSILPEEVPFEVGDQCYDDWAFSTFSPVLGWLDIISGVQVYFHPAGFGPKYYNDIFHVEDDLSQWVSYNSGDEILVVEFVWTVDNLEGNNCPHGPYAQFYILVHLPGTQPNTNKFTTPEIKNAALYGADKYQLLGPIGPPEGSADSWEFCWCVGFDWLGICWDAYCVSSYGDFDSKVKEEWVDYIFMNYTPGKAAIHKWGSEKEIYLTLREKDDEPNFGRVDDYMGLIKVEKEKTKTPCGVTYKLNVYDNTKEDDNPNNDWDVAPGGEGGTAYHYPTKKVGAHLRLRTIVVP